MQRLKITRKDRNRIILGSLVIFLGLIALILFKNILIFGVFCLANAFMNYYQGRQELPFDITPSLVLVIIFSIKLGFSYGLLFLFLGSLIPSVIARGFDHMTPIYFSLTMGISYLGSLRIINNFIFYGVGLIIIQTTFSFLIAKVFSDDPMVMFSVFFGLFLNIIYFIILTKVIPTILM
jgi:hypothetical protein